MAPPVAVYVVAAVVGVAALFAFKEYVYEPHLAPRIEAWAEDFLERRRAARNRGASAVPVNTSRRHRDSTSSSDSSHHSDDPHGDQNERNRARRSENLPIDEFELEALAAMEVHEWRDEVLRSQEMTKDGLRRRRTVPPRESFDGFDSASTTLDESFTSLTHTPLAYVISNISSPVTASTVSLPGTPSRRHRSESLSARAQRDANTSMIDSHSPSFSVHEIPAMSPRTPIPVAVDPTSRPLTDGMGQLDVVSPSPLTIPHAVNHFPAPEVVPHPLPFTPTYQIMADDSPFGPLLPDTPRSSAGMYGERPFSPITRVMGSSSGPVSSPGSMASYPSRANSMSSSRTLGGSGVLRKGSALANEVVVAGSDDSSDEENHSHASTPNFRPVNPGLGTNESVVSSLSERYPAPPTPPVILSPSTSSAGVISAPSSPSSSSSEVVIHVDALPSAPHSPSRPLTQIHPPLPLLRLPLTSPTAGQMSRSRSQAPSATSSAHSYASFLSPLPLSQAASESEADEFLSVASDDSEWSVSPATPGGGGHVGPVPDRANNPFLDFEDLGRVVSVNGSEHGSGSDGSEVVVSDVGREGGSDVGSDESWGSARRH